MSTSVATDPATALKGLSAGLRQDQDRVINRLFFAARNGAIERVLRTLEHHFKDKGLPIRAVWEETSFPAVSIQLILNDKRTGEHTRRVWVKRESVMPESTSVSTLVYALEKVTVGAYYGGRTPKVAEAFDAVLATESFTPYVAELIKGVNYPFVHEHHSSF